LGVRLYWPWLAIKGIILCSPVKPTYTGYGLWHSLVCAPLVQNTITMVTMASIMMQCIPCWLFR
jgi:hypothetical protein